MPKKLHIPYVKLAGNKKYSPLKKNLNFPNYNYLKFIRNKAKYVQNFVFDDEKQHYLVNSEQCIIGLNTTNGVVYICFPNLLMMDFDEKDGPSKGETVDLLMKFVKALEDLNRVRLLFDIYETDNGIHCFLVSHFANANDAETLNLMMQLRSDEMYIAHTIFRGFCIRLSPKPVSMVIDGKLVIKTKEDLRTNFIAKNCYNYVCSLGTGTRDSHIENMLAFKMHLVEYFKNLYIDNSDELLVIDGVNIDISPKYIPDVKNYLLEQMKRYNIPDEGSYFAVDAITYFSDYDKHLPISEYKRCKSLNWQNIYRMFHMISGKYDTSKNVYLIRDDPNYKLTMAFDVDAKMLYFLLPDFLKIDWDFEEGMTTQTILDLMRQFFQNVRKIDRKSIFNSLTFRLFETQHGVHAFCTSHPLPYEDSRSLQLMMQLCCDPWYIAFSKFYGYSVRLTPKVTRKRQEPEEGTKRIYTQAQEGDTARVLLKPVLNENGETLVLGQGEENPAFVSLLDLIIDTQSFVLRVPDLVQKLKTDHGPLLPVVEQFVKDHYDDLLFRYEILAKHIPKIIKPNGCRNGESCPCRNPTGSRRIILTKSQLNRHDINPEGLRIYSNRFQVNPEFVEWHRNRDSVIRQ